MLTRKRPAPDTCALLRAPGKKCRAAPRALGVRPSQRCVPRAGAEAARPAAPHGTAARGSSKAPARDAHSTQQSTALAACTATLPPSQAPSPPSGRCCCRRRLPKLPARPSPLPRPYRGGKGRLWAEPAPPPAGPARPGPPRPPWRCRPGPAPAQPGLRRRAAGARQMCQHFLKKGCSVLFGLYIL